MTRKTTRPATAGDADPDTVALPTREDNDREPQTGSAREQFPSAFGDPATEVAHRSADGSAGTEWHKTFVVLGEFDAGHPIHADNQVRVYEEAIQRGMHPKGDARLIETEQIREVRGLVSSALTYAVDVVPAVVDHAAPETVTAGNRAGSGAVEQARGSGGPAGRRG